MSRAPRRRGRSTDSTSSAVASPGTNPHPTADDAARAGSASIKLSYAEKVRDLLRESLMDAAAEALATNSWTATRMADIAAAVGVSRQTVYNEFGNKDDLGRALLLRESGRFLGEVEAALDEHPHDAIAGLSAALEVFLRRTEQEPLLRAIIGGGDGEHSDLGPLLTGQGATVLPFITARLSARFQQHWPKSDDGRVHAYADAVVRLAVSHVVFPMADPATTAAQVTSIFAPYLSDLTKR
ncbi:TetR family transcriptional regulator [Jatrophihabitans telluris]|uniref:TetR family transcriptional regulator n=1 Tax=Jatrophihabitans telluris TaxID=2038343 RepID=A0ABY4QVB3_9ACTN|nr:TetR family transcriptional regulator [Jatrophihabitans telluris]UQX87530.1 TetR family transcriptional regulator [Jatrophihabitans telluris]